VEVVNTRLRSCGGSGKGGWWRAEIGVPHENTYRNKILSLAPADPAAIGLVQAMPSPTTSWNMLTPGRHCLLGRRVTEPLSRRRSGCGFQPYEDLRKCMLLLRFVIVPSDVSALCLQIRAPWGRIGPLGATIYGPCHQGLVGATVAMTYAYNFCIRIRLQHQRSFRYS
jgi:hypothetical protein